MKQTIVTTRDIARELARKYSTMTHNELDTLESILVPMKYAKGEMILSEGEVCKNIYYIEHGLIRQFYFKNGKEVTEHLGEDHTIFMCIAFSVSSRPDFKWRRWNRHWSMRCPRNGLKKRPCTMSTSRCSTVRYWRKV